jgi:hypothetical protein
MKPTSFLFSVLFAGSMVLSSCNEQPPAQTSAARPPAESASETAVSPTKEAAVYECPMGCEGSRSSKPGKCPVCEMELEKKS